MAFASAAAVTQRVVEA